MTSIEKRSLKKEAQHLKATFQVGSSEIHSSNKRAILESFNTKELLKVKVNRQNKDDKMIVSKCAEALISDTEIEIVDIIGNTIILFKKMKDKN